MRGEWALRARNRLSLMDKVHRVAPTRSNLIRKGMIHGPAHGDTAFTVPLFGRYLKRTMPNT